MSDPIETLRRLARDEANPDDAMRVLASHDGWYAPVAYAMEAFGTDRFERVCVWGTETRNVPPGRLCLFTGVERGPILQAKGVDPGPCVGPLRGSTLFEKLPSGLASADINAGFSTSGEGWVIVAENFDVVREWGRAVAFERALATPGDDFLERVLSFSTYHALSLPSKMVATAVGAGGLANPAMIFTARDCMARVVANVGANAGLRSQVLTGREIFERYEALGVTGIIINILGPGPQRVLNEQACRIIVESLGIKRT